jgi:hypothetical protein
VVIIHIIYFNFIFFFVILINLKKKVIVDSCLVHGLKKDFFNKNTSFNLLKKLSKISETAKRIVNICDDLEKNEFRISGSNFADSFTSLRCQNEIDSNENMIKK